MADAQIPFADPYRADLVQAAAGMTRTLKEQGGACLEARFLRVPAGGADEVIPAYRRQLEAQWTPVMAAAPPFGSAAAFRRGSTFFAAAVADRAQDGWTGVVIVTNSFWDQPSRDALANCLKAS